MVLELTIKHLFPGLPSGDSHTLHVSWKLTSMLAENSLLSACTADVDGACYRERKGCTIQNTQMEISEFLSKCFRSQSSNQLYLYRAFWDVRTSPFPLNSKAFHSASNFKTIRKLWPECEVSQISGWEACERPLLQYFFSVSCSIISNGMLYPRWSKETGSTFLETAACSLTPSERVAELLPHLMSSEVKSFNGGTERSLNCSYLAM